MLAARGQQVPSALIVLQRESLAAWTPVLIAWSCLGLLPFGRAVEVPVLVMAAGGIYFLVRRGKVLSTQRVIRIFSFVFLLAWVPVTISLIDAVNFERTLVIVVNHLRFYFAGVFMIHALGNLTAQRRFLTLAAWLLGFWVLDALVQFVIGVDLFGREPSPLGLSGIFGADGKHFAVFMAIFSPLLWEYARRCWPPWLQALVYLTTVFVVVSAGSRAAWVILACVIVTFSILICVRRKKLIWKPLLLIVVLSVVVGTFGYQFSQPFRHRVDQTALEIRDPFETGNLGHRAWIWRGAWNMFLAHPVNGVGARGFRYAFGDFAEPGDPYLAADPPVYPTHSHQMLLEVATETGTIGLAGFFALICVLARVGWRANPGAQRVMLPFAVALAAAFFPLNTHWAIYGAHLSQALWFIIALYLAALAAGTAGQPASAGDSGRRLPIT